MKQPVSRARVRWLGMPYTRDSRASGREGWLARDRGEHAEYVEFPAILCNVVKHVLTHYCKILRAAGRGEGRRVRRNFATEFTREGEVDVAQGYLALVRVLLLKQSNVCAKWMQMDVSALALSPRYRENVGGINDKYIYVDWLELNFTVKFRFWLFDRRVSY